jgi:large repetitive protein
MIEGAYAVSFDVQRVCLAAEGSPSINLINVAGQPDAQMTIQVYRLSNLSEKVDEFFVDTNEIIQITYEGAPAGSPHNWLNQADTYVIKGFQNQSFCPGEPTTPTHEETFEVTAQMSLVVEKIKQSLPEPKNTGGFLLRTVIGGLPFNDGDGPYYLVSLVDPASGTVINGPLKVSRNGQGNYQKEFRNLPVGNFQISVMDAYGCEMTTLVIVPTDTQILIPNIFTPNNDTVNDLFEIVNLPDGEHQLVISNRWGKEVFASSDYKEGKFWDADGAPEGIYFYRLKVDGGETYTGWVEIKRASKP